MSSAVNIPASVRKATQALNYFARCAASGVPRAELLAEFNARFVGNEIKSFGKDLPAAIRKALRKAIHASKLVAAEMKALVGPA